MPLCDPGRGSALPGRAGPGLALDGVDQWDAIAHGHRSGRDTVVHNVPTAGLAGAIRHGDMKLLFDGMQTVSCPNGKKDELCQRVPPPGFTPAVPDTFPAGVNVTVGGVTATAWLFNISADPLELHNLVADPTHAGALQDAIGFFQGYQKGTVEDLATSHQASSGKPNPEPRSSRALSASLARARAHTHTQLPLARVHPLYRSLTCAAATLRKAQK